MTGLFEQMVAVAGRTLGASVAPFTLSRLLFRARVFDRETLTPAQMREALPVIEGGLAEFLLPAELRATMDELAALADRAASGGR